MDKVRLLTSAVVPSDTTERVININFGERHRVKFGYAPEFTEGANYCSCDDGEPIFGGVKSNTSTKYPANNDLFFGYAISYSSAPIVGVIKVFGIKIHQFGNLIADLVPYQDGDEIGLMNRLDGKKFPGSNLVYGKD